MTSEEYSDRAQTNLNYAGCCTDSDQAQNATLSAQVNATLSLAAAQREANELQRELIAMQQQGMTMATESYAVQQNAVKRMMDELPKAPAHLD